MIKYPVRVQKVPFFLGGFRWGVVEAGAEDEPVTALAVCFTEETAKTIANALNAMNTIMSEHPELAKFDFDLDKWYLDKEYQMNAD